MRSRLLILIVSGLFICIQHSRAQTPQELNAKIEASTSDLYTKAALWGTTFVNQYNNKQDYGELAAMRAEMEEYIDDQLSYFKELKDVNGSDKLKDAVVAFFEYEKNLVKTGFMPFEKLTASSSDEQINNCRQRLKDEAGREREFTSAINTERKAYAQSNNISLDPPPPPPKPAPKKPAVAPTPKMPATATKATQGSAPAKEPVKKAPAKTEEDDDEE